MNLELPLAPAAPARARAAVSAWLGSGHAHSGFVEIALLLVSELVTNGVQHGSGASGGSLHLRGSRSETTCRIELWNPGTQGTVAPVPPRDDGAAGGFGLDFVDRLSDDWGVERDAHGTTVWFVLRNAPGA
jgi:serine/threonine-protein kinase RsbW